MEGGEQVIILAFKRRYEGELHYWPHFVKSYNTGLNKEMVDGVTIQGSLWRVYWKLQYLPHNRGRRGSYITGLTTEEGEEAAMLASLWREKKELNKFLSTEGREGVTILASLPRE